MTDQLEIFGEEAKLRAENEQLKVLINQLEDRLGETLAEKDYWEELATIGAAD